MFAYFKERQLQEAGLCRNIDKIISWHSEVIKSIDNYSKYPEKEKRSLWNRIHNESNGYLTNITKVITEYLQYEEEYNQAPSCKIDTNALFKMYEKVYDTSLRLSEATKQREKNIQKWMNIKTKQNHNVARHLKYLKPYARNPTPSANYNKFRPSSARTAPTLKSELLNIQIINRPQTAYQKANGTLKPHILREFSRIAGYKRYGLNTWAKNAKGKLSTRQPAPHLRGLKPWIQNAQGKLSTRQPAPRRRQPAPRPGSAPEFDRTSPKSVFWNPKHEFVKCRRGLVRVWNIKMTYSNIASGVNRAASCYPDSLATVCMVFPSPTTLPCLRTPPPRDFSDGEQSLRVH